jgi:aldehyde:ferredoxin oxidoreductase
MKGFFNRLIRINVRTRESVVEEIPDALLRNYMGGKGLGTYLLLENNPSRIDPMSPENRVIFATGCVTDLRVHGSSRYGVYTKSPQTEIYSESYSGGRVALPLSRTGYDAIILEDASPSPVFIEISSEGTRFHDGSAVWGKSTYETEDQVLETVGVEGAEAVVIGPAGENGVKFSVLESGYWRSAGRTGVGAILGSKKVKALVFHGNSRRGTAHPPLLAEFWERIHRKGKDSAVTQSFKKLGTPMLVSIMNVVEGFPTKYWSQGTLNGWENITAESLLERCHVEPSACPHCFMACGNLSEVKEGRHKGLRIGGPEYETIYAFGGLCMINNIEEIIYLNDLCDRLGMDTISAGNLAAFTIEAAKKGAIDEKLEYGDVDGIARLLEKIAYREGIGAILSDGIVPASRAWGMEDFAIHVKGLEPAGYEPRVLKGMGLSYATSDRGACHLRATFYKSELSGEVDPDQIRGKARLFVEDEDRMTLFDTLILCRFYKELIGWEDLELLVHAITGLELTTDELRQIAVNVINAARWFNLREGVTRSDDTLPKRFSQETIGKSRKIITKEELNQMLDEYYESRGWDRNGVPPPLPSIE